MATVSPTIKTLADLQARLGGVSLDRIRFRPPPGSATVQDVLDVKAREGILCELVDGVLLAKAVGFPEAGLAAFLLVQLDQLVRSRNLGIVTGPDGTVELMAGLERIPDVAFTRWDRLPGRPYPAMLIPRLAPNLAVEVLSRNNIPKEMAAKRQDYFTAGVKLVWEVDPQARTVVVYTAVTQGPTFIAADTLDGSAVLPGFTLALLDLFAELDRHGRMQTITGSLHKGRSRRVWQNGTRLPRDNQGIWRSAIMPTAARPNKAAMWLALACLGLVPLSPAHAQEPRLRATLNGHINHVLSVAFSPDGKQLASVSADARIKFWDVAGGNNTVTLMSQFKPVASLAFSPDGKTLAAGCWDSTITLWDVASRQQKATFKGHATIVTSMAFRPNGRTLASGSWDTMVKLWDITAARTGTGERVGPRKDIHDIGRASPWPARETIGNN